MKRNFFLALLFISIFILMTSCKKQTPSSETKQSTKQMVDLTVWGADEDKELLQEIIVSFKNHYADKANFNIVYQSQSESHCKDSLLGDLENAADVFAFADDQVAALAAAGVLDPIKNQTDIRNSNLAAAADAASVNGKLYAYPLTADNGYFLYYNKAYFSENDIQSFNRMIEIASTQNLKVTMDWSSAWYVYSFFGNTGLKIGLNEDGITNYCNWNSTDNPIKGVDVAQAMLSIASSSGFANMTDEQFLSGVKDGSVIAGISGVWNSVAIEEAWGENTGAAKLPTYTCAGQEIQMASFSGCKLIGVNAYSKNSEWAAKLAEWITNEKNQTLRFVMRGQGPSNIKAANSSEVQSSLAITALIAQSEYSQLQRVGGKFWDPVSEFAVNMSHGNPNNEAIQVQLDRLVKDVTSR